ncbi:MAG: hypothetical protein EOP05_03725 [Proteobacteria bacterium]|nr:MAG: hypothetical protein EOP05_03725 [Pseudomonadota bacterium]
MPNFKLASLFLIALTVLSACGSKSNNNTNNAQPVVNGYGTQIAVPLECQQTNPWGYGNQGRGWGRHQRYGFSRYEWGSERRRGGRAYRYGQTGCGPGSFPACSQGVGIVCVPNQAYMNTQVALFSYQMGNQNAIYNGYGSCANGGLYAGQTAQTMSMVCQVSNPIACNGLARCMPVSERATIGVCVQ